MAVAVGQSRAQKVLLPVNSNCGKIVVGVRDLTLSQIMVEAVESCGNCAVCPPATLNEKRKKCLRFEISGTFSSFIHRRTGTPRLPLQKGR